MPVAGYKCLIRRSGASTSTTSELLNLVTGFEYQIATSARKAIDPNTPWHFKNGAATIAFTDILALDFAFGDVTFATSKSSTVTFNGSFLPMTTSSEIVTEVKSFSLKESSDLLDKTVFTSTSRFVKRMYGLADAELSLDLLLNATDMPSLATAQMTGRMQMIEIATGATPVFRGYGKLESLERTGSVDGLIEATLNWKLAAERDDNVGLIAGYSIRAI